MNFDKNKRIKANEIPQQLYTDTEQWCGEHNNNRIFQFIYFSNVQFVSL